VIGNWRLEKGIILLPITHYPLPITYYLLPITYDL
ncbi:MAG TPA: alpha/beta hydrolase, partial [Cyanobacteria bacterium UBA11369]|nr:alpha/beta hydrolase [Cyanobacteria bacterium UBA11369]